MNLDTYINIVVGFGLAVIITVILAIIDTKRNRDGRQKIKKYLIIIAIIVVFIIAASAWYFVSANQRAKDNYENLVAQADFELSNGNYIASADSYNKAYKAAYDLETEVESLDCIGSSYLAYGLDNADSDFYRKALDIYTGILNNTKYEETTNYQFALVHICFVYYFMGYRWDNADWTNDVELLENNYDFNKSATLSDREVTFMIDVAYALGLYYENATYSNIDNFNKSEYVEKALFYYDKLYMLSDVASKNWNANQIMQNSAYVKAKIAEFMLTYAIADINKAPVYLDDAISLCNDAINQSDFKNMSDYLLLKKNVGKGYWMKARLYPDTREENLNLAYTELAPLIHMDEVAIDEDLLDIGYYAALTGLCTEEELNIILNRYERELEITPISVGVYARIRIEISAVTVCAFISDNYENYPRAQEMKQSLIAELNTSLNDFLSDDDRQAINQLKNGFFAFDKND